MIFSSRTIEIEISTTSVRAFDLDSRQSFTCTPHLALDKNQVIIAIGEGAERLAQNQKYKVFSPLSGPSIEGDNNLIFLRIIQHCLYMLGKKESWVRRLSTPKISIRHNSEIDKNGYLKSIKKQLRCKQLYVNGAKC